MSKGNPRLTFRLSRKKDLAIRLLARQKGQPVGEYLRVVVEEHLRGVSDTHSLGVRHLEDLTRLTREFITRAQLERQNPTKVPMKAEKDAQLPGVEKRSALEELTWKAVQAAVLYSKTEDAAKDAEARLLALRVANGLMRTELMILKHTDDAFVDALLKELGVDSDGLAAKTRKES
ncbi:MAG: hypothetical protein ABSF00_03600 [Candidatus Bathyarchaeia archaeon]|jgi:hypothetical protein